MCNIWYLFIYSNKFKDNGKSQIYIDQPILEDKLKKQFIEINNDAVKFLVGPTGVGKTTLIRNVFHVFDRDVAVTNNNLIIYVSFYSMVSYYDKMSQTNTTVQDAILGAISYLDGRDYIERLKSYNETYYNNFYDFIYDNNKHLIQTFPSNSINIKKIQQENAKKYILDWLAENKAIDYTMCQLKYYLYLYKKRSIFDNIILILDDLESLDSKYMYSIIDFAFHCKKCLPANINHGYNFKALISMRNYSYRTHIIRRKEAFRQIPWDDVILKDTVPDLSKVIETRTNYVLNLDEVKNSVEDKDSFKIASLNLKIILLKMYGKYDKMLLSLTHNNIFESMTLLFRILTNKAHMGKYEIDRITQNGAFDISARDYNVENRSNNSEIPGNDDVFYALVYGEHKIYYDKEDYYLTNIMHYKSKDKSDTQLLGIYIIQYFIFKGVNLADPSYDGFESLVCSEVIEEIMSLYSFPTNMQTNKFRTGLESTMEHLYKGGVLLQSIIEPIIEDYDSIHRIYTPEMKVYLSLRGNQLYNMLSYNALLFTVYRDDIETEIDNNDILTLDLSMSSRMIYCLNYINYLSDIEFNLIRSIKDYKQYKNILGSNLAIGILMNGIRETIKTYYTNDSTSKFEIRQLYQLIENKVNNFLNSVYVETRVKFTNIISL